METGAPDAHIIQLKGLYFSLYLTDLSLSVGNVTYKDVERLHTGMKTSRVGNRRTAKKCIFGCNRCRIP